MWRALHKENQQKNLGALAVQSKINSLGWKAKIGLEEGIKDIYNWYVENAK